ncbi:SMC family ATPase [Lentibacillus sp. L22]|uniref:AAA family ATPase n=1 Tax=Lentibacillus TaxID=175304 RepID=UPI0022B1A901|nr:SMC family ATPase [Lentibacillus daqui]
MRPLTLTMTAFGPYKDKTTIDFNELQDNKLFVISGNTGAGKTTIFDAICFALYGAASGQDRENNNMLRSQFANDDTHTSVELIFELNNKVYRILRQLGHVKKGNKTKTGERYEFYELVDGGESPCVDRQIVSEIDKKVETLMGLTQDQFKQIVMLPQGEFRKLLTSQTENKEDILRRLFKTEPYKHISERLRYKKDLISEKYQQEEQKRNTYVENIRATLPERDGSPVFQVLGEEHYNVNQVLHALDQEVAFYQQQIMADQKAYEQAYQAHDKKQTEFHAAKSLNERFQELEDKKIHLSKLEQQTVEYDEKEKQLKQAEQAAGLEAYEKQLMEWRQDEQAKKQNVENAEKSLQQANEMLRERKQVYEQEEKKASEQEDVRKKLDRLQRYLPIVEELDQQKQELQDLQNRGKRTFKDVTEMQATLTEKKNQLDKQTGEIKQLDTKVDQLPDKQEQLMELGKQSDMLKDYLDAKAKQAELEQILQEKKQEFVSKKRFYQELEQAWLNNQAFVLANHLHDGEACPVCGSKEHPNKAISSKGAVTKQQLEAAKKALDKKDKDYSDASAKVDLNQDTLQEKVQKLADYSITTDDAETVRDRIVTAGKKLKAEVMELRASKKKLQTLKGTQETLQNECKQLEEKKEQLDKNYQKLKTAYESARAVYQDRLKQIPEEVQVLTELKKQIKTTEQRKSKLEQAWETAQKQLQQAKEAQTKAASNSEHANKQLAETTAKLEQAEQRFYQALDTTGFSTEEAYQRAKRSDQERQDLRQAIEQFKQNLSTTKQLVQELKTSLNGKQKADLSALQEQLETLKQAYESALNKRDQSKAYFREAGQLIANIRDANEQVKALEKQLSSITDLYDVLRGQNSRKISFERYLQIEYLEQIIESANERLKRLSNGQFFLIRSERQEAHGRQSGLGLDVYDAYTGQTRDVKTLSGGEKFNASLCLALGMSDVIQSFQGNISIETMFIDEGFGTLDEESLNKAIDALIDLQQSGRMIGVISHVQELKNIFPAVLEVKKTREGHSHTQFVVK